MSNQQSSRESSLILQQGYTYPNQQNNVETSSNLQPTSGILTSPKRLSDEGSYRNRPNILFKNQSESNIMTTPSFNPVLSKHQLTTEYLTNHNYNNAFKYHTPNHLEQQQESQFLSSSQSINKSYSNSGSITPPSVTMGDSNSLTAMHSKKQQQQQQQWRVGDSLKKKEMLTNASGSNLNVFLRGDRRHSLTHGGTKSELLDSPKLNTPNLIMTTPSSNSINLGTNMRSSVSTNTLKFVSSAEKKRLVDQFYRPNIKGNNHAYSSVDLASFFRSNIELTPGKRKWMHDTEMKETNSTPLSLKPETKLTDELFHEIINQGGFKFEFDRTLLVEDDELINFVLNIDTILDEYANDSKKPYEQLETITTSMADKVVIKSKDILLRDQPIRNKSLEELQSIENYLTGLKLQTQELITQLGSNRELIRSKYREEINNNIEKLNQVSEQLKGLEKRSNSFKEKITEENMVMSQDMIEKLELLENINVRMREYSRITKARRFKILEVFFTIAVVVFFAIYYGYNR